MFSQFSFEGAVEDGGEQGIQLGAVSACRRFSAPALAAARITALSPGQSPLPLTRPIFIARIFRNPAQMRKPVLLIHQAAPMTSDLLGATVPVAPLGVPPNAPPCPGRTCAPACPGRHPRRPLPSISGVARPTRSSPSATRRRTLPLPTTPPSGCFSLQPSPPSPVRDDIFVEFNPTTPSSSVGAISSA